MYIGFSLSNHLSDVCGHDFANACCKKWVHGFFWKFVPVLALATHHLKMCTWNFHIDWKFFSSILLAFFLFLEFVIYLESVRQSFFFFGQQNSSETTQQNFMKLSCSCEERVDVHIHQNFWINFFLWVTSPLYLQIWPKLNIPGTSKTVCQHNSSDILYNFIYLSFPGSALSVTTRRNGCPDKILFWKNVVFLEAIILEVQSLTLIPGRKKFSSCWKGKCNEIPCKLEYWS